MVDLDFFITYLKNTKFVSCHLFNRNQNIVVFPADCCSNYTNIVTQYTLVFLVYFGSFTITKPFLLNVVW